MLSYMNLFDGNQQQPEEINELWEGADTTSLLPPELELESRILETKDYDILEAKKITDKYFTLKKELKENKKEYSESEEVYENYLNRQKELSTAILNFTNSISNMQTLLNTIQFNNLLNNSRQNNNNLKNNEKLFKFDNNDYKDTKEYIDYLLDVNKKIHNSDSYFLEKINEENSRLNKKCADIEDKMKIIRNMIMISIKESLNNEDSNELKVDSKTCPICFESEVSYCLNPCGHLICYECSDHINNSKCPTCRQYYSSKIKVYFSI